ncbi:hypothetical protein FLK61_27250 [Paenalkalicoccus suaedae]|uniref:XRE family transcriptional regulator n=1 Tax=Paenalkalicoccus suaedae TaxID=2592382 RepID=A0A859FAT9_9BACI|nr:hypothetical protein [Paenalkalicoccus suaedae]QKS70453.1 hypothetical protein FLK61_27250 [Paenalkalicoccus suaedae]
MLTDHIRTVEQLRSVINGKESSMLRLACKTGYSYKTIFNVVYGPEESYDAATIEALSTAMSEQAGMLIKK